MPKSHPIWNTNLNFLSCALSSHQAPHFPSYSSRWRKACEILQLFQVDGVSEDSSQQTIQNYYIHSSTIKPISFSTISFFSSTKKPISFLNQETKLLLNHKPFFPTTQSIYSSTIKSFFLTTRSICSSTITNPHIFFGVFSATSPQSVSSPRIRHILCLRASHTATPSTSSRSSRPKPCLLRIRSKPRWRRNSAMRSRRSSQPELCRTRRLRRLRLRRRLL